MSVRNDTHAGSWYSANGQELDRQLNGWLTKAKESSSGGTQFPIEGLRAIIAPHAGYSYSGPAAAYAYKCIDPESFKRVFILGPSHHVYLSGCAVSKSLKYKTPLGDLILDRDVIKELVKTGNGNFTFMSQETDEDEHSIEMHLPYVYKVFEGHAENIKIVPILVGALSEQTERQFGRLLAPYLNDPENLFIVSTDFCHWGLRFSYTYYVSNEGAVSPQLAPGFGKGAPKNPQIFESIEKLDREGMEKIEQQSHSGFCKYLSRTKNTICGRHPIGVLMAALEVIKGQTESSDPYTIQFVHYSQSSSAVITTDSSVSYASAFVQLKQ